MFTLRKGNQLIKSSSSEVSYILRDPALPVSSSGGDDAQKIDTRTKPVDLESKLEYLKSVESCFRFLQVLLSLSLLLLLLLSLLLLLLLLLLPLLLLLA